MTLSLLLSSFYFGLALCYRYALDAIVGGDFLQSDEDQACNVIKNWLCPIAQLIKLIQPLLAFMIN